MGPDGLTDTAPGGHGAPMRSRPGSSTRWLPHGLVGTCNGVPMAAHPQWLGSLSHVAISSLLNIALRHHCRPSSPRSCSHRHLVRLPLRCPSRSLHTSRHCRSGLSIFLCRLACGDMVPCIFGLIGVQFNPICIQFIYWVVLLYSISPIIIVCIYLLSRCIVFVFIYWVVVLYSISPIGFVWGVYHVGGGDTNQGKEHYG
jgi:hypothetical protein